MLDKPTGAINSDAPEPTSDDQPFLERHANDNGFFNLPLFCLEFREASTRYHIRKWEKRTGEKWD
jgi:hypothetical protein